MYPSLCPCTRCGCWTCFNAFKFSPARRGYLSLGHTNTHTPSANSHAPFCPLLAVLNCCRCHPWHLSQRTTTLNTTPSTHNTLNRASLPNQASCPTLPARKAPVATAQAQQQRRLPRIGTARARCGCVSGRGCSPRRRSLKACCCGSCATAPAVFVS